MLEAVHVELSKHEQVLVDDGVDEELVEDRLDDRTIIPLIRVQLKHEHGQANVDQDNDNNEANVSNVADCLCDQGHIERRVVEESQPVEHSLDPLAKNHKRADGSLFVPIRQWLF